MGSLNRPNEKRLSLDGATYVTAMHNVGAQDTLDLQQRQVDANEIARRFIQLQFPARPSPLSPAARVRLNLDRQAVTRQRAAVLGRRCTLSRLRAGWNRWQCARVAILRSAKSSLRQLQAGAEVCEAAVQKRVDEMMGWVQDLSDQVVRADNPQVRAQRNEQQVLSTMCTSTGDQLRQALQESKRIQQRCRKLGGP